ncbi:MAG: FAD-dependent thymidylate synthase [Anaerolineales bacterium]
MPEAFPREVYLLQPRRLSPETIAVTFAKTSRSPLSFREIAEELTDEASARFHEKWVVGYGHASVAEHAVLHIAFENVSRLAIECIESNRLASYTEKSTRYQMWDANHYFVPGEVLDTPHEALYRRTCDALFAAYAESLAPVRAVIEKRLPPRKDEDPERYEGRIRSNYVDVCRFLLPAAALANVGMTANARVLEHAIRKMLSHPLQEVRQIGEEVKQAAQRETPTLVKYAERVPYRIESGRALEQLASGLPARAEPGRTQLLEYEAGAEIRVLAAALFAHGWGSYAEAHDRVEAMDQPQREELARTLLGGMEAFDTPPRALEHTAYTFEVVLDQGAYFELKRHRMMTQSPQELSAALGYAVPRLVTEAGFEERYHEVMQAAQEAHRQLASWNPHVAAYLVPNGFNRRILMTLNLREAFHLCELRSAPNAHFSMRRLALQMAEQIREVHPLLAGFMRLPEDVDWRMIERENFTRV